MYAWSWLTISILLSGLSFAPAVFSDVIDEHTLPEFVEYDAPSDPNDKLANRAYIIYNRNCRKCFDAIKKARSATERLVMNDERWQDAFVYYDHDIDFNRIDAFASRYMAHDVVGDLLIVFVDENQIERRFQIECSTPLDVWSMAWLYKGIDERPNPPTDNRPLVRYPLTGGWWSVDGDWNPTRAKLIRHLHDAPLHERRFELFWLELLTYEELQSVHTDHHLELTRRGQVKWEYVNKETPPSQRRPEPRDPRDPRIASGF